MLQKALSRFMLQAPILESMVILLLMVRQYLFLLDKSMVQWEDLSSHINDYASLLITGASTKLNPTMLNALKAEESGFNFTLPPVIDLSYLRHLVSFYSKIAVNRANASATT